MNLRVDMGEDFAALVEETALANPDWAAEVRLWRDRWIEMAQPEIAGSVALLTTLKARGAGLRTVELRGGELRGRPCAAIRGSTRSTGAICRVTSG
jgi:hypothetical protein